MGKCEKKNIQKKCPGTKMSHMSVAHNYTPANKNNNNDNTTFTLFSITGCKTYMQTYRHPVSWVLIFYLLFSHIKI